MQDDLQVQLEHRIRVYNSQSLNPFISVCEEYLALQLAELRNKAAIEYPLFGQFIAVKDNISTCELPTTAGTPALRNWIPEKNAPIVQKLLDSGCILFGKTNLHELSFGVTTGNLSFGIARNPANNNRIPGGSSGGSAIAVVLGIVSIALGTDTAGSIRIPASFCGCVGYKPSLHRYSTRGVVPLACSRDTVGLLARSVEEILRMDAVLVAEDGEEENERASLEPWRIGIPRGHFYEDLDPSVLVIVEKFLRLLEHSLHHTLVNENLPFVDTFVKSDRGSVINYECYRDLAQFLKDNTCPTSIQEIFAQTEDPTIRAIYSTETHVTQYHEDLKLGRKLQKNFRNYFAEHNLSLVAWPTVKIPACPIGAIESRSVRVKTIISNTNIGSVLGCPAISIPIGVTEDGKLPVGIELIALNGQDRYLLHCAKEILCQIENRTSEILSVL